MPERSEQISKSDLQLILDVNKKSIQMETERMNQNEEIISSLNDIQKVMDGVTEQSDQSIHFLKEIKNGMEAHSKLSTSGVTTLEKVKSSLEDHSKLADRLKTQLEDQTKTMEKLKEKTESISNDLFRIQILFITGFISIVLQVIQMFKH